MRRYSQADRDSLAVYKFMTYDNAEDLNVERSYAGIEKLYPTVSFSTKNGRPIVSPKGFVQHMFTSLGLGECNSDIPDDCMESDTVSFRLTDYGWTWVAEGHTDPVGEVIYYSFGEAVGCPRDPIADYVDGVV
mgnify:CR=1 FL=1